MKEENKESKPVAYSSPASRRLSREPTFALLPSDDVPQHSCQVVPEKIESWHWPSPGRNKWSFLFSWSFFCFVLFQAFCKGPHLWPQWCHWRPHSSLDVHAHLAGPGWFSTPKEWRKRRSAETWDSNRILGVTLQYSTRKLSMENHLFYQKQGHLKQNAKRQSIDDKMERAKVLE